ncbi:ferritin-like domain-containing protein [Deinococcus yavapaiensis]|uniref:Ferritin-like protein n=1 Tax=Deinococcus yavapaiensis KR-236 TaxID=694435 RepID=A0A318S2Q6_9DEIO|nr:ferritin-like domain-containing protein [Deinococcus yavapaiensis]PYE50026.1 ferritin-like protein [Deinococcus yavapaiensis KR-236]
MTNDQRPSSTNPRRRFLSNLGLMGAGAVLAGCAPTIAQQPSQDNGLDVPILNFALNLEYLEAAFYAAAVGRLAEVQALGGSAAITLPAGFNAGDNNPAGLSADILSIVQEIAEDEINHVKFLRNVLKSAAVNRPALDLSASFAAAGSAASGGLITGFNPFANELFFLHGAFVFEDVGVTAYKGAARFIDDQSANGVLEQAAGILAVEAYHAGTIRTLLYQRRAQAAAAGLDVATVVQKISDLRDAVDGSDDRDQGIVGGTSQNPNTVAGAANIVPTDQNGVAFSRTPRQVANIVFLQVGATKGGFYPNGISADAGTATLLGL